MSVQDYTYQHRSVRRFHALPVVSAPVHEMPPIQDEEDELTALLFAHVPSIEDAHDEEDLEE